MFKVIYLPSQNNIVVDMIDASDNVTVGNGASLLEVPLEDLPEISQEALQHIKENSYTSFKLHKVENGEVLPRTAAELQVLPSVDWERLVEPIEPIIEEEPVEEPPVEEEPV
jgi:hypothetical protein